MCSNTFGNVVNKPNTSIPGSSADSKNSNTIRNDNYFTNISSAVENATTFLYSVDNFDSENVYDLVENTITLSGAIKSKETDPDTNISTQQIWDKHFTWSKEENNDF